MRTTPRVPVGHRHYRWGVGPRGRDRISMP